MSGELPRIALEGAEGLAEVANATGVLKPKKDAREKSEPTGDVAGNIPVNLARGVGAIRHGKHGNEQIQPDPTDGGPDLVDKALGYGGMATTVLGMGAMAAPMAAKAAGSVIGAPGTVYNKLTGNTGPNLAYRTRDAIHGRVEKFNNATVGGTFSHVGGQSVNDHIFQPVANAAGSVVGGLSDTKAGRALTNRYTRQFGESLEYSQKLLGALDGHTAHLGEHVEHLDTLRTMLHDGKNIDMAKATEAHGKIVEALEGQLKNASQPGFLKRTASGIGSVITAPVKKVGVLLGGKSSASALLEPVAANAHTEYHTLRQASRQADGLLASLQHTHDLHGSASTMGNLGETVRGLPGEIGKAKLGTAVMKGAFVAGSALTTIGMAKGFSGNLSSLKQMCADIEGKPVGKISTAHVMFGSVPESVKACRKSLMMEFGPRALIEGVNLNYMVKDAVKGHMGKYGMMAMFGSMAASTAVSALTANNLMPAYGNFKDAFKKGQEISAKDYADFVTLGSEAFRNMANAPQFSQALGEEYAQMKASPEMVLRELNNGKAMQRLQEIVQKHEHEKSAPAVQAAAPATPSPVAELNHFPPQQEPGHFVNALQNGHGHAAKPVMGEHTGALAQRSAAAAETQYGLGA